MTEKRGIARRDFFKQAAGAIGAATQASGWPGFTAAGVAAESIAETAQADQEPHADQHTKNAAVGIHFPRVFTGSQLKMLAFPLGGVAAGSIALGGRGQLRDWEIFNRPNKGFSPSYAFPAIWVQSGDAKPVARVLEARILPPYEGQDGLGSSNAPGLSRLAGAEFTGQYPLARVRFLDPNLPVHVSLEAFSPFIPHDPDDSGLPVAILRYRLHNPGTVSAKVSIAFSVDNPVHGASGGNAGGAADAPKPDSRSNEFRSEGGLAGLVMSNSGIAADDPRFGSFVLAALTSGGAGPAVNTTYWRGWPKGRWWNSPLFFWDSFSRDGALLDEPQSRGTVSSLCQQTTVPAGGSASITFLLAWHFPNRTPGWCGWDAPAGEAGTIIGNFYSARFKSAWEAAQYTAANLTRLEARTRAFTDAFAGSTLPDAVKEAASANLSTLATTTCFRTADGEFHGFEGSDDKSGCCFGNCLHVWNYETATAFLFPSFARSLRDAAFGYSMDDQGGMRFRQLLPDGKERFRIAAADGQMGQILHAYLDWKLSGDNAWLRTMWPRIKRGVEFAWIQGGWDANRDGVFEGVQHTTYDVEFYGPNPLGGVYYLGALRAAEEMAIAVGEKETASEYRRLFTQGSRWIDEHLFQGEFYRQQVLGYPRDKIAPQLISGMGSENTETPEYQVGGGCLVDQLLGQYLANVAGLGPLVSPEHIRATLESIYRYNYKRSLADHDSVQRTYALNEEAAVVVCDYGKAVRPKIPFPYYAEAWTGLEYSLAALMFHAEMVAQGVEVVENLRARYDGEKRNPWDEAECGHHYARAMASWTSVVALSGFEYDGAKAAVVAAPRVPHAEFKCFWSTGTGWGTFAYSKEGAGVSYLTIKVLAGKLPCRSIEMTATGSVTCSGSYGRIKAHAVQSRDGRTVYQLDELVVIAEGKEFSLEVQA
ncbi:non-lysosomal glucosylceramidase [Acidicapsa acidisoli]|uniref:non-lysosomal glucosylceramidase n=1 Tax=Acidicapsa acidisoli TaxID=1615681 RepID=UPI0021DFE2CE|nr:non-lysosomal glucosylceramidase [Acidicapsa acidisoli]